MPQIKVRHFAGVSTEVGSLADSGDVISMPRSLAELTIDGDRWRDNTGTCWTVTQFTRVFESNNTWSWLCWVVDGCMALIEAFTSSRQPASRSLATEQSSAYTDACGDSGNVAYSGGGAMVRPPFGLTLIFWLILHCFLLSWHVCVYN